MNELPSVLKSVPCNLAESTFFTKNPTGEPLECLVLSSEKKKKSLSNESQSQLFSIAVQYSHKPESRSSSWGAPAGPGSAELPGALVFL